VPIVPTDAQSPIADYALISDCRSAALVSRDGSVDWLCFPRFDGPALFARLLDPDAGHWSIHPVGDADVSRRYLEQTLVLETTFRTPTGTAVLTDAMAVGRNERGHELGAGSPGVLLRALEVTEGEVELALEFAPRPEYGLVHPLLRPIEGGLIGRGGADQMVLSSPVPLDIGSGMATARFRLSAGASARFALDHGLTWMEPPRLWAPAEIEERLDDATRAWRAWSKMHQSYEGPWRDLIHHSGRVLQALTYQPTGAIVAAPTTSLPEAARGPRNWDYRYAWIRDASLTMEALWVAACPDEAVQFFRFMSGAVAGQVGRGSSVQIMFGVGGEHDLSERELPHLRGYRGSRPVRVGNGAWRQQQLDVYGEVLSAAHRLVDELRDLDPTTKEFLAWSADAAADRWVEKDHGIWEVRGEPKHFLHSKLMCWVALERAVAMADFLGAHERLESWISTRDEIRAAILENAWNDRVGAFTQAFGSDELDASALTIPIVGFLPGDDPRVRGTIDAIEDHLTDERGLVYRYRSPDGLPGEEGTFLLCAFWLAHALALAGELDRAKQVCERAAGHANDVGLFSEEVDPVTGALLGNFPQAFSHIGLVNASWAIVEAEQRATEASR
jgi:GH15 family glucan-1,4-alpha-glucosidase